MYRHDMEVYRKKFDSEGWATEIIDGHDVTAVLAALDHAKATKGQPLAILARTIKGHGVSSIAGKEHWHGRAIPKDQLAAAIKEIGPAIELPLTPAGHMPERHCLNPRIFRLLHAGLRSFKACRDA